jgi:hypothetical protein
VAARGLNVRELIVRNHNSRVLANFNTVVGALAHADSHGLRCEVDWRQTWDTTDPRTVATIAHLYGSVETLLRGGWRVGPLDPG